jgi:GAF domain-containing protein
MAHADLGGALARLDPPGTGFTRAAVRQRAPVWIASIAASGSFARRELLVRHGIQSGAGFPVLVGQKMVAVLELLSLDHVASDTRVEEVGRTLVDELGAATQRLWRS